jgi:hypothetical protein
MRAGLVRSAFSTNKSHTSGRIISRQVGQNGGCMLDWNSFLLENSWSMEVITRHAGNFYIHSSSSKIWSHIQEKQMLETWIMGTLQYTHLLLV